MQVQEYIFRSPYPSRVQIGVPENTTQNNAQTSKQTTKIEQQQIQKDINQNQIKAITGDKKLTPEVNSLDIYA